MPPRKRAILVATAAAFAVISVVYAVTAASGGSGQPQHLDAALPLESLRTLCRDGGAEAPAQIDGDAKALLQHFDKARAACNQLVDASGLQGLDLADALLDRADLDAPGDADSYARSLADFDRAIALAPNLATAHWRRGKANLLYGRDLTAALQDLDKAIRLDPAQARFFVTRASILSWLGEPNRALFDLDRALSLDPRSVHALTNRGLAYLNSGNPSRALADFDAALLLAPDDSGLYGFRASARRATGDEAGAKADDAKMGALMFGKEQ